MVLLGPHSFPLMAAFVFLTSLTSGTEPLPEHVASEAQLLEYRKVWDAAPHNEFTDLVRFKDQWIVTFREGRDHTAPGSDLRIMISEDGEKWSSAALLAMIGQDLRDPKLCITSDGRVMLNTVAWFRPAVFGKRHQSLVWFSEDGRHWKGPHEIGDPNVWIWRVTWHKGVCYGVGYHKLFRHDFKRKKAFVRLYRSTDGIQWNIVADDFLKGPVFPNEAALAFGPDDTAYCLVRCSDYDQPHAIVPARVGVSRPPYTKWTWKELNVGVGGPELVMLEDGRLLAACRYYGADTIDTRLSWLDPLAGTLKPFLSLPSGFFNGYPALVEHDGLVWVSNHASYEDNPREHPCIYVGKVRLPAAKPRQAAL